MRKAAAGSILGLALTLAASIAPAAAHDAPGDVRLHRRPPLRLEVRPSPRYYRQCTDSYAVEHRITGDTITPQYRCRWVLRR